MPENNLSDEQTFLIDFNVQDVAVALGFPIPQLIQFIPHMGYREQDGEEVKQSLERQWTDLTAGM